MNASPTSQAPTEVSAEGQTPENGAGVTGTARTSQAGAYTCPHCGGAMADTQNWCLHCGSGAPEALRPRPNWRALASIAIAAVVLTVGAAAAAYAALSEKSPPRKTVVLSPPTTVTATPTAQTGSIPTIPTTAETTGTPTIPPVTSKPPTIPLSTPTPTSGTKETGGTENNATKTTTSTPSNTTSNPSGSEEVPSIVLDTNAASTYNPYGYPESGFGEPGLAIDGDPSTAWSATVQASSAPRMAEGLVIDLKSAQKVRELELITPSKGMTVEIYGSRAQKPPATILDKGWTQLASSRVVKKSKAKIKLHESSKGFRFILLWMTKAPPGSTTANPGQVSIDELTLFPAS